MKNIYITDLDHTFLKTDLTISSFTKEIWNSFSQDTILSIATARTYKKTVQFLSNVHINAPMILLDGALIATMDKKIIDTKFISKDIADGIIEEGAKLGIYPFVLSLIDKNLNEAFIYPTKINYYQREILTRYAKDDNLQQQLNIKAMRDNFKIVYFGEQKLIEDLACRIKEIYGESLKYIIAPEVYVGCYFLTILHKDADKSYGIRSVSESMGFDLAKLTVFGDNYNDIGMFELAGTSVAMSNAQEGVKQKADIILKYSNDEDGVARYLQSIKKG